MEIRARRGHSLWRQTCAVHLVRRSRGPASGEPTIFWAIGELAVSWANPNITHPPTHLEAGLVRQRLSF